MRSGDNWKISSAVESGIICGKNTTIAVTQFKDKYFIVISDCGKIGSLVQVLYETSSTEKLYNSKVIFGKDEPEVHAVACALAETCKFNKPVIFGFSFKDYNASVVKELKELILKTIGDEPKQDSHVTNFVPKI